MGAQVSASDRSKIPECRADPRVRLEFGKCGAGQSAKVSRCTGIDQSRCGRTLILGDQELLEHGYVVADAARSKVCHDRPYGLAEGRSILLTRLRLERM